MILRKSLEWLGGSFAVYFVVVACGSSGGAPDKVAATGGRDSTGGSSRGGVGAGGSDSAGFGFGGIPDPTPDAGATEAGAPGMCDCPEPPDPYVAPEPLVIDADCDVFIEVTPQLDYVYAVIPKPSALSEAQVLMGHAVLLYPAAPSYLPPGGFTQLPTGLGFSDDSVLVNCGNVSSGTAAHAQSARFVFPR